MKGKMKRRILLVGVLVAAATVTWMATREDARFTRAAAGLERARQEAASVIGPETWPAFRERAGVPSRDDRPAWDALRSEYAPLVNELGIENAFAHVSAVAMYRANQPLFEALPSRVENLVIQHHEATDPQAPYVPKGCPVAAMALSVAIVASADLGDSPGVVSYSRAAWRIIEAIKAEPDVRSIEYIRHVRLAVLRAMVYAAVSHRDEPDILSSIQAALSEAPEMPALSEIVAGEARSFNRKVVEVRTLKRGEIGAWLERLDGEPPRPPESVPEWIRDRWGRIQSGVSEDNPQFGPNTARALEARYWEAVVGLVQKCEGTSFRSGEGMSDAIAKVRVTAYQSDPSYWLSKAFLRLPLKEKSAHDQGYVLDFVRPALMSEFTLFAARSLVGVLQRWPVAGDLPLTLPDDLLPLDPFGGKARYQRTKDGFRLYTRGEDAVDGGFVPTGNGLSFAIIGPNTAGGDEWGLDVCYGPPPIKP